MSLRQWALHTSNSTRNLYHSSLIVTPKSARECPHMFLTMPVAVASVGVLTRYKVGLAEVAARPLKPEMHKGRVVLNVEKGHVVVFDTIPA